MKIKIFYIAMISVLVSLASCKKFLELPAPETSITKSDVYENDDRATAVVSYIYYNMASNFASGFVGLGVLGSLSSDELKSYATDAGLAQNRIAPTNQPILSLWTNGYKMLYQANLVMDNIANSPGLSASVKTQLAGECKFIRAYLHFYLANYYGDVPLILTSDYQANTAIARTPVSKVYESIIADLKDAQTLLTDDYMSSANKITTDRGRPNKAVATALLARVYLYTEQWANAEAAAGLLIQNPAYILEPDPAHVFLTTSKEAIWQLEGPTAPYYTLDQQCYAIISAPLAALNSGNAVLSTQLLLAFESGDTRRNKWVSSFTQASNTWLFPGKYKSAQLVNTSINEYLVVFRLAEQYLIRAEARAQQGKLTGIGSAAEDIYAVRHRAGLGATSALTFNDMMKAIEQERKIELFTEGGHRWLDLKRWKGFDNPATSRANEVMPAACIEKGGVWDPTHILFPIPTTELKTNTKLVQNPGYTL